MISRPALTRESERARLLPLDTKPAPDAPARRVGQVRHNRRQRLSVLTGNGGYFPPELLLPTGNLEFPHA